MKDANGETRGVSKRAARAALYDTCITRMVLPMPLLLLPPTIMSQIGKLKALRRSPRLSLVAESVVYVNQFIGFHRESARRTLMGYSDRTHQCSLGAAACCF